MQALHSGRSQVSVFANNQTQTSWAWITRILQCNVSLFLFLFLFVSFLHSSTQTVRHCSQSHPVYCRKFCQFIIMKSQGLCEAAILRQCFWSNGDIADRLPSHLCSKSICIHALSNWQTKLSVISVSLCSGVWLLWLHWKPTVCVALCHWLK